MFIDFTGHGCVNCREMEAVVWSDPKVLKRLKEDYVVVALYVDEKTELPKEELYVSAYDGRVKKTIGGPKPGFYDSETQHLCTTLLYPIIPWSIPMVRY